MAHRMTLAMMALVLALALAGCNSPYYADKGALLGGLAGAGVGTAIGDATGHEGAGAIIGAATGALTGAAIGSGMDEVEAKNRAQIASQLGRQVPPGNVTLADVVAMTRAGVDEELIASHIRANGLARPLQTGDLITLQQEGVSKRVIQALQEPRTVAAQPAVGAPGAPPAVIVEQPYYPPPYYYGPPYYYPAPYWGPRYYYHHHHGPRRGGWGFAVGF